MESIKTEKKKTRNAVIRWFFGILFLLMCFSAIIEFHIIAGLLFLLAAIIAIPPAATQLERKSNFQMSGIVRFFVVFIIIMFASAALPNTPTATNNTESVNSTNVIAAPPSVVSGDEAIAESELKEVIRSTPVAESNPINNNEGKLDILTSPAGATITIDGNSKGLSPLEGVSVDAGTHTVNVYLPGYYPQKEKVEVVSSETKELFYTLIPETKQNSTSTSTQKETAASESKSTEILTSEATSTHDYDSSLVRDYDVIEEDDTSMKALTKPLSSYTQEELNSLPLNIRKEYRVVVSPEVSKEELKSTLIQVVMDKTSKNNDIDEVVVFAYDRKEDVNNAFTLGKVEWCPNGNWDSVTPEIASGNDRSSYQYIFDIKDKVGNVDASDRPTDREYEIYDYYNKCYEAAWGNIDSSDPKAMVDEDLVIQKVAEKYGITEEEANRICNKVVLYEMS